MLNRILIAVFVTGFATSAVAERSPYSTTSFPVLPEAVASFGACASDNWLYVYSGHIGRAHQHSIDNLSKGFRRLNLLDGTSWEELPPETPLQSVSLVTHEGLIYRVGGLSARNRKGEEEDLHSVTEFSRFDPQSRAWEPLIHLPEPRSSHDAAILDGKLFVVGGWNLQGEKKKWHETAWSLDLTEQEMRWQPVPNPHFQRRAIAVASAGGKLFVLGGMTSEGGLSKKVHVYDPATKEWSAGPDLPGNGFGVSAIGVDNRLYTSGMDGTLYRLKSGGAEWEKVRTLVFPRFFHRLVPKGQKLLAVGGAGHGSHLRVIEPIPLKRDDQIRVMSLTLPFPGRAKNRQGAFLVGNNLYVCGGNNSLEQHDFDVENFENAAFRVNLGSLTVNQVEDFPRKRQSMSSVVVAKTGKSDFHRPGRRTVFVGGGFGHDGKAARTQAEIFSYRPGKTWNEVASLPQPRSQFGLVAWDNDLWVFGGLDYDADRKEAFHHPIDVLKWNAEKNEPVALSGHKMPVPRRAFGGTLIGNKYYMVGGMRERFQHVEQCDVFDFESETWETISSPNRPRVSPELVSLRGKLYLAGGSSPKGDSGFEANSSLEIYDPDTSRWSIVLQRLPIPPRHVRMFAFRDRLLLYSAHVESTNAVRIVVIELPDERTQSVDPVIRVGSHVGARSAEF